MSARRRCCRAMTKRGQKVSAGNATRGLSQKETVHRDPRAGGSSAATHRRRIFVVQKHDASRLHYDFRLAIQSR